MLSEDHTTRIQNFHAEQKRQAEIYRVEYDKYTNSRKRSVENIDTIANTIVIGVTLAAIAGIFAVAFTIGFPWLLVATGLAAIAIGIAFMSADDIGAMFTSKPLSKPAIPAICYQTPPRVTPVISPGIASQLESVPRSPPPSESVNEAFWPAAARARAKSFDASMLTSPTMPIPRAALVQAQALQISSDDDLNLSEDELNASDMNAAGFVSEDHPMTDHMLLSLSENLVEKGHEVTISELRSTVAHSYLGAQLSYEKVAGTYALPLAIRRIEEAQNHIPLLLAQVRPAEGCNYDTFMADLYNELRIQFRLYDSSISNNQPQKTVFHAMSKCGQRTNWRSVSPSKDIFNSAEANTGALLREGNRSASPPTLLCKRSNFLQNNMVSEARYNKDMATRDSATARNARSPSSDSLI